MLLYLVVVCRSCCLCVVVEGDRVDVLVALVVLCECFVCGVGGGDFIVVFYSLFLFV